MLLRVCECVYGVVNIWLLGLSFYDSVVWSVDVHGPLHRVEQCAP